MKLAEAGRRSERANLMHGEFKGRGIRIRFTPQSFITKPGQHRCQIMQRFEPCWSAYHLNPRPGPAMTSAIPTSSPPVVDPLGRKSAFALLGGAVAAARPRMLTASQAIEEYIHSVSSPETGSRLPVNTNGPFSWQGRKVKPLEISNMVYIRRGLAYYGFNASRESEAENYYFQA